MSNVEIYESLIAQVYALDRTALIARLSHYPGDLRLDFTEDFLSRCDDERLRHLLLAAEWRARCKMQQI
jgi:hypothetical protein